MSPRTTGILLCVALALGAFVWFYELEGESGRLEAEERTKRLFSDLEPEGLDWIAFTTSDGEQARVERSEGAWRLVAPLEHPADAAVERMAEALATLTHEAVLDDPGPDAEYGLDEAGARVVRFGAGGAEHELRLGRRTPVGSNVYAKADGGDAVYTVASYRKNGFERSLDDLRDKRILSFDQTAVREVEASWPDGRVVVESVSGASAGEEGSGAPAGTTWRMKVPVEAPGDADAIDGLLSSLAFLRADAFLDAPGEPEQALLAPPEFAVTLRRGEGAEPLRLAIGRVGEGERRPVRVGAGAPRYWIAADRLDDFPRASSDYRDRTLASLDPASVRDLDFFFHTSAGESVALHASRDEAGDWRSEPEAFAEGALSRIVSELAHLEAEAVLAESMGSDELRGVGLSPPNTILTVLGEAPEGGEGDDALPPEAPILLELRLGDVTADGVVARRVGEDTVYRLALDIAERLPVSYAAFQNRFREAPEPAEAAPGPGAGAGAEWVDPHEESP